MAREGGWRRTQKNTNESEVNKETNTLKETPTYNKLDLNTCIKEEKEEEIVKPQIENLGKCICKLNRK